MTDRATVAIQQANTYDEDVIRNAVTGVIEHLGGWGKLLRRGDRVLVKPNCITKAPASKPAQTHPAVVLEVCRQLLDFGAIPFVGDSPAWSSLRGNLRKLGLLEPLDRLGVEVVDFNRPVKADNPQGQVFDKLTIDAAALEADAIVNLPKFKAHGQLLMTVAIKNMFGCVGGRRKAWWHLKAGSYDNYFSRMLVETYELLRPAVSIVDGVIAMHEKGPVRGSPYPLGAIMASTDAVAIERIAAEIVGARPGRFRTLTAAIELGIGVSDLANIDIVGTDLDEIKVDDFILPKLVPIGFSLPRFVRGTLRQAWLVRQDCRQEA